MQNTTHHVPECPPVAHSAGRTPGLYAGPGEVYKGAMARVLLTSLLACLLARALPAAEPKAPNVSLAEGRAMVALARSAMDLYRTRRTPPSAQPVPPELAGLRGRPYPVSVTLRKDGQVVARVVEDRGDCTRNLISAALLAMRSDQLPDRITADVLNALTVEVEVIAPPEEVSRKQAEQQSSPGHTGLHVSIGGESAYLLASATYVLGLRPEEMPRMARSLVRLTPANARREPKWRLFASRHYVGYPDGKVVWLLGGAAPIPEGVASKEAPAAAASVAAYLMRHQGEGGGYNTHDAPGDLPGRLHCTAAMARLSRKTGDAALSASVDLAIKHALPAIRTEGEKAWLHTEDPNDRPTATALLCVAIGQKPADAKAAALLEKLRASLDGQDPAKQAGLPPAVDAADAYRRMFKPLEAYFAADPAELVGGVRGSRASAKVTLRACADAIHAFLDAAGD